MPTNGFGPYRRLAIAQSTDPQIQKAAQNGGVVTALLTNALQNGTIDGAIISTTKNQKPFYPIPTLATTKQEIIQNAGTRYTYSPNTQALPEITKQNRKAVAFVGTPCQTRIIRNMQRQTDERAAHIKLLIGLMCSQTYTYEGLIVNHIQNTLGINLNDIQKIDIKHQMIISTKTGQTTIPLKNLQKYARKPCQTCSDFSSEQADISTGSLGLQHSTFTIIRTRTGEQAFNRAEQAHALTTRPVQNDEPSLKLLQKLSQQKHQRPDTT